MLWGGPMDTRAHHPSLTSTNPVHALWPMAGNTPLLEIFLSIDGAPRRVFAKWEAHNLTGSIKDRMAMHILACAYEKGAIEPGWEIVEATSGNTGISFCALGRALGHPVRVFMPDWMSAERVQLIESYGAQIVKVSAGQGGFVGSLELVEAYARDNERVFLPQQFSNPCNVEAHALATGPEIIDQLASVGLGATAFVAGVGTGGTVMGVGQALREDNPKVRIHPLEPKNSPVLSTGKKIGCHRIQGVSDEFIPAIVNLSILDQIISVDDGDAILMAQKLSRGLGLAVGISSGANMLGALKLVEELGEDAIVVTVLPDSNKKYLSTALLGVEPVLEGFLSPRIELKSFRAIPAAL